MRIPSALAALLGAALAGCPPSQQAAPGGDLAPVPSTSSVLMHHKSPSRDGRYVDAALTRAAVRGGHLDPGFAPRIDGVAYAQPLYLEGGPGERDLVLVVTEHNRVYAFDAQDGAVAWQQQLGAPVALGDLPCGNIDPLGITGTPVIDPATRTMYLDAMTTPDGGATKRHLVFALRLSDGGTVPGWPVDVAQRLGDKGLSFKPEEQNQRGALLLLGGTLYVPYGGNSGDCGGYHGWVVAIPVADATTIGAFRTRARGGGIWAPGGLSADGAAVYAATGNTFGADSFGDGEAVVRLGPGAAFSQRPADFFSPTNWKELDDQDADLGGSGPVLFDLPGATPSRLVLALGKDGLAYLLDRDNLGGIHDGLARARVSDIGVIGAAVVYRTASGTYAAFKGLAQGCSGEGLVAVRIQPGAPPAIVPAWCGDQRGRGLPAVSTVDGHGEAIVWSSGAENTNRLVAFDGESGALLASAQLGPVRRYQAPIIARGRVFVAGDDRVYAFTTR